MSSRESNVVEATIRIRATTEASGSRYYCWCRQADPESIVPTRIDTDAAGASEEFIPGIRSSTPWPQWEPKGPKTYGPVNPMPEIRVCIDVDGREYLVGPIEWAESEEITHAQAWSWFGPDERAGFERLWASMKRGKNEEWF